MGDAEAVQRAIEEFLGEDEEATTASDETRHPRSRP